jgi:hypothetical protein
MATRPHHKPTAILGVSDLGQLLLLTGIEADSRIAQAGQHAPQEVLVADEFREVRTRAVGRATTALR